MAIVLYSISVFDDFSKSGESLYQTLGLPRGADHDAIKKAYRKASRQPENIHIKG